MSSAQINQVAREERHDDLSAGIPEIDEAHRRFISMVNALDHALNARKHQREIQRIMNLLIEEALQHFRHEERLFAQYGYPDAMYHAGMHAKIMRELVIVKQQFDTAGFSEDWIGDGLQIRQLLMDHLLEEDMKYRGLLQSHRQLS